MASQLPGAAFAVVAPQSVPSPLRSDVAGFIGRCRRGPVDRLVRIEGWRSFVAVYGDVDPASNLPWAVRGYFENGGEVAHIRRVFEDGELAVDIEWTLLGTGGAPQAVLDGIARDVAALIPGGAFPGSYRVRATSPGRWIGGTELALDYVRWGAAGRPEVQLRVSPPGEPTEYFSHVDPTQIAQVVNASSRYVRFDAGLAASPPPTQGAGPSRWSWTLTFPDLPPDPVQIGMGVYRAAAIGLADQAEIALVVLPDLHGDSRDASSALGFLREQLEVADKALDRLVIVDPPPAVAGPERDVAGELLAYAEALRANDFRATRAGALYFPWLLVPDPTGGPTRPLRSVPPSGHVAGLISRLDRERGPSHSPANARLLEAVGFEEEPEPEDLLRLHNGGTNRIRCHPRDGLVVWGARTVRNDPDDGGFIAHRRLLHRLVRAIRRAAAPLVFDTNGPELWLALIRAVATVLMPAFRSGALKGTRPDEAFRIKCDQETNPPEAIDVGQCLCEVSVAPAVPMEFIELRIHLSRDGALEVLTP